MGRGEGNVGQEVDMNRGEGINNFEAIMDINVVVKEDSGESSEESEDEQGRVNRVECFQRIGVVVAREEVWRSW